jgi:hypothetical protein
MLHTQLEWDQFLGLSCLRYEKQHVKLVLDVLVCLGVCKGLILQLMIYFHRYSRLR